MRNLTALPLSALALLSAALLPTPAHAAGSDACGGIDFWNVGECHFEFDGQCEAMCEPVRFVGACTSECAADIDVACSTECSASCVTDCQASGGYVDCSGTCTADCEARACAQCDGDAGCIAVAEGHCSVECEAQCEVVPPTASCETACEASCEGSCEVDANVDCFVDCAAELEGGCNVDCHAEGGLFCDGQYIPAADLPGCLDYLTNNFDVDAEAEGNARMSLSCATADGRAAGSGLAAWVLLLGLVTWRRRRSSLGSR